MVKVHHTPTEHAVGLGEHTPSNSFVPSTSIVPYPGTSIVPAASTSPAPLSDQEIVCPATGEVISINDVDGLVDAYERLKAIADCAYSTLVHIRQALGNLSEGTGKTRRLRGRRRACKVEMPGIGFQQSLLKEAFNAYPQFRDEFLRIASIDVKLREYAKLKGTKSDQPDFECFRGMIVKAECPPTGNPTITVEV